MKAVGVGDQIREDYLYRADATIASTNTAQLVLANSMSRSSLILQNLGSHAMYIEIGAGRAHATLSSGVVTSLTVDNAGFGFTNPPLVRFLGGGSGGAFFGNNPNYLGLNQPGGPAPSNPATAIAVLSGNAINSFTITNGGSGYVKAPYVLLINSDLDPYGCSAPSTTSGFSLPANQATPVAWNGATCPTQAVAVYGTQNDVLFCAYMT